MFIAAQHDQPLVAKVLCKYNHLDTDYKCDGKTATDAARLNGSEEIIKVLSSGNVSWTWFY